MKNLKNLKNMMNCLFLMMVVITGIAVFGINAEALENIVINQVYVDPIDTEAGGEAIELYNPSPLNISIGSYRIMTESSINDVVLAEDAYIAANSYYLIADIGWSILKDNEQWPNADHEEALTMYNTNSGIALVDANNTIIDAVGWGDSLEIEEGLYEILPTANPESGYGIIRTNFLDTDNNFDDFLFQEPNFHNSSFIVIPDQGNNSGGNETQPDDSEEEYDEGLIDLPIVINLTNSLPSIASVNISIDDLDQEGYQIIPSPGQTKIIPLNVLVIDNDGGEDIDYVEAIISGNGFVQNSILGKVSNDTEQALFSGNITMDYYLNPGDYNVQVSAFDKNNEFIEQNINYEYLSLVAFDIDVEQLIFDAKNKQEIEISGDNEFGTLDKPTIKNLGNTNISLGVYSENLAISDNKLQFSLNGEYYNVSSEIIPTLDVLSNGLNQTLSLGFKLVVEKYLKPDAYLANLNIVGVAS